jgi:nitrate reductase gamma subunit
MLILVTGNQMRFMGGLEMADARQFVSGLLTLQPMEPPPSLAFQVHLLLVCALLVYIPFSKLMHLGGLVFSPTLNQRNNPRERRYA